MLRPCPPTGGCTCAASPASSTRPLAVGRRLPGHVGEPGDPGRAVDPVVGPVDGDERLAEIAQGGLAGGSDVLLGHHDPHGPRPQTISPSTISYSTLPRPWMPRASLADAQLRLLGHLDLGDQGAGRRVPPGELDAGRLADQAAPSVAPDEVLRPQRLAVGQLDVDAGVVLANPVTSRPRWIGTASSSGMTPEDQLRAIAATVRDLVRQHRRCLMDEVLPWVGGAGSDFARAGR